MSENIDRMFRIRDMWVNVSTCAFGYFAILFSVLAKMVPYGLVNRDKSSTFHKIDIDAQKITEYNKYINGM